MTEMLAFCDQSITATTLTADASLALCSAKLHVFTYSQTIPRLVEIGPVANTLVKLSRVPVLESLPMRNIESVKTNSNGDAFFTFRWQPKTCVYYFSINGASNDPIAILPQAFRTYRNICIGYQGPSV